MVLIFAVFLYIFHKLYRNVGVTPSLFLISGYLLSSIIGLLYLIYYKENIYDYSYFSMVYYIISIVIFLMPLIRFSGKSELFTFPNRTTNIVSYVLIVLGFISLFFELKDFNYAELAVNWLAARNEYYSDYGTMNVASSFSERISSNIMPLIFITWPLAMYHFSRGKNKKLAILLILASSTSLINSLKIAERQGIITYIANALFSYLIFKDEFTEDVKRKILIFSTASIGLLVFIVGAITFSRFGEEDEGLILSLASYGGVQPFNAAFFLEELHSQALGGKLNFPFITGTSLITLINDEINSTEFLNVFGSIVGSFYLDFGYFSVFVIALFSFIFYKLMKIFKSNKSLLFFYIYALYFEIMFLGIFYYRYNSPPNVRNIILFGIMIYILEHIFKTKKVN